MFLYYILLTDQVSLTGFLYFSRYWTTDISPDIWCTLYEVKKLLSYIAKNLGQKCKYLKNDKNMKEKIFFIIFKELLLK